MEDSRKSNKTNEKDRGASSPEINFESEIPDINGDVLFKPKTLKTIPFNTQLLPSIEQLIRADPKDVLGIAASQLRLLDGYHQIVFTQSRRSFSWALIGAGLGLLFFMSATGFIIWTGNALTASIPVISGAVIEVIAGVVFYLYGKAATQLSDFHDGLEILQRYLIANSICESLEGDERNRARAGLIISEMISSGHPVTDRPRSGDKATRARRTLRGTGRTGPPSMESSNSTER